jgi:hypothetical protein
MRAVYESDEEWGEKWVEGGMERVRGRRGNEVKGEERRDGVKRRDGG